LIFVELAAKPALHLPPELRDSLRHELLIELVVSIHAATRFNVAA
jgi:hypothetical protein